MYQDGVYLFLPCFIFLERLLYFIVNHIMKSTPTEIVLKVLAKVNEGRQIFVVWNDGVDITTIIIMIVILPHRSLVHRVSLTFLVNCVSIMKLWTCFSALVNSNFLEATVTNSAVQPAPC